jgi:alkylhydroperoxidase/carboxymuconolactone decarboxylase family protein YurZ
VAISETAQKNHDQLFPGHLSTLKVTDPELIEIFDNFAFDETLRHTRLDARTRLMVQLAALIGCPALSEYRAMLAAALANGSCQRPHRPAAIHRLPSHAQRPQCRQRGRARIPGRTVI